MNADEYRRRLMFGLGKPIVSFENNGFRFVAIGMDIAWSKNWKTFPDFLSEYLKGSLSPEWGKVELAKPSLELHPIIRWVHHIASAANKPMSVNPALRETAFDGTARAYLGLAYHLFLCVKTQALLTKRLRKKGTFAGALYEANVIGWFIRAGFKIDFEDESDVNSTHCEFTATHPLTGKKFSVEAKIIGDQSASRARRKCGKRCQPGLKSISFPGHSADAALSVFRDGTVARARAVYFVLVR